jgi:hypothetical protein
MSNIDVAKIYAELSKLNITLNFNDVPTPGFIQERTFECNTSNWKVDKFYLEVTQELGTIRRLYKIEKFNFESRKRQALTNNDDVKNRPTGKERESALEELFEEDLRKILDLENEIDSLKDLICAIKTVQDNIKETSSGIRVLVRTMESQINRLNIGSKEDSEVAELHKTFADLDKMENDISVDEVESSSETQPDDSGDELTEGVHKTATPEVCGQDEPVVAPTTEEATPDEEATDAVSSFLMDDSDETEESDLADEEEVVSETPAEVPAAAPTNKEPAQATGSKQKKVVTQQMDMDLSEIGIDLGVEEDSGSTPEKSHTDVSPKKGDTPVVSEVKASTKKAPPPEPKKETPPTAQVKQSEKKDITDIDLDLILNSLDSK